MMTDAVADLLTRIRNANRIERPIVDMPGTKLKGNIVKVLKEEGFVADFQVGEMKATEGTSKEFVQRTDYDCSKPVLRVFLKYGPEGERVIRHIARASRPGRRLYRQHQELRPILDGLGIAILSTSRGVMSDRQARAQRLGGELLCTVW